MSHFDIFNGDADGICALHQLRLALPLTSTLVTGVKRDIALLDRLPAHSGDSVTVLDISPDRNRDALQRLLAQGVQIAYFDHHFAGGIPRHGGLHAHIDPAPDVCTSVIVDRYLQGRFRPWAVVGAFGDNLERAAKALARSCSLTPQQATQLRKLGEAVNYNAYGDSEADLLLPPALLYACISAYASPFDFIASEPTAWALADGRRSDMAQALPASTICRTRVCWNSLKPSGSRLTRQALAPQTRLAERCRSLTRAKRQVCQKMVTKNWSLSKNRPASLVGGWRLWREPRVSSSV